MHHRVGPVLLFHLKLSRLVEDEDCVFVSFTASSPRSMTFRATRYLKSILTRSVAPAHIPHYNRFAMTGEFAPVYVVMGMVTVAVAIGLHTAKQQLRYSPGVYLSKKKRDCIPEVEEPDDVIADADKLINMSFLRKVAHIQNDDRTLRDPSLTDAFTRPRKAETLKSVGVNPHRH